MNGVTYDLFDVCVWGCSGISRRSILQGRYAGVGWKE